MSQRIHSGRQRGPAEADATNPPANLPEGADFIAGFTTGIGSGHLIGSYSLTTPIMLACFLLPFLGSFLVPFLCLRGSRGHLGNG